MSRKRFHSFFPLLIAGLVSTFISLPAGATTTRPASTNASVATAISASLKQNSLPKSLTPSLESVSGENVYAIQGTSFLKPNCDPYNFMNEAKNPKPCIYGATKSKRTIVIFGDSFVGNWLPALNLAGKSLGYRIAAFEFAGCITSFVPPSAGTVLTAADKACDQWHTHLPAAVRAQKPVAILAANGTPSWGPGGDPSWIQGIQTAFNEMTTTAPNTIRVLISISPHTAAPVPPCLASYATSIQKCGLTYTPGVLGSGLFSASLVRDQNAATAAHATLMPTVQWFCVADKCPPVIGNVLVYADSDHTTTVFSEYLAKVFQQELAPILTAG
jgi:SGNH domain (fused to AT3 domains)